MRFCTSCGSPLEEGDLFCMKCGAKVIPPAAPAPEPEPAPQPAQQVYYDRYAPPLPPAYPAYRQPGGDWGRSRAPMRKPPLKHKRLLRFLSFLFALGLFAAAAGFGSQIYYSRFADRSLTAYLDQEKITDRLKDGQKESFAEALAAGVSGDVREGVKAQQQFSGSRDEITGADLARYEKNNKSRLEKAAKEFGLRWTVLKVAMKSEMLIVGGGILCGVTMILWFALGGRLSRFSRTASTPLLTMFIIWGLCLILLAFVIPAVNLFEIDEPAREAAPAAAEETEAPQENASPSPYDFSDFNPFSSDNDDLEDNY